MVLTVTNVERSLRALRLVGMTLLWDVLLPPPLTGHPPHKYRGKGGYGIRPYNFIY